MSRSFSDLTFAWRSGWFTRISTGAKVDDARFSDEDVLTILRAGESGLKVEALCAAGGIPIETYYVWKAKYTGLSPLDLRARRQRERQKARTLKLSATVLPTALIVAAVLYGLARTSTTSASASPASQTVTIPPAVAARPAAAARAPRTTQKKTQTSTTEGTGLADQAIRAEANPTGPAVKVETAPAVKPKNGASKAEPPAPPSARRPSVDAAEIASADPNGPSVQVAAVPSLEDARVALERLASLGYPAHMTTRVVNQTEMYRVRVGPLKSRAVAEDVARKLERDGFPSPWITK
ncbi:MAG: SPOR domain-containing protein [Vicinamibacterales bacterium]